MFIPKSDFKATKQHHKKTTKSKFTKEEDELLRKLVAEHGENEWARIASLMGNRNARQCRERWRNYMDPNLTTEEFTKEDENLLLMKFRAIGPHWNRIAQYFPKRSVNSIRNRVVRLLKNFGNHASHHLFGNFYNCQISPLNNLNQNNSHNCFYPNYTLNQHQFNNQMFYNHYQMMQNQQPTFTPQQIYANSYQIPANSFPSPQCTSESETETATSSEESESDTVEEISTKLKADEFAELFSGIAFDDFDTSVGCNLF